MSKKVAILDYGIGNLLSAVRALEQCDAGVSVLTDGKSIKYADRLIVPGVGAFADCVSALKQRDMIEPILDYVKSDRPVLGICVGMQMMFEIGEEFGEHPGLGIMPGRVTKIDQTDVNGEPHKIPHIGWSPLLVPDGAPAKHWERTILKRLDRGTSMYFVHSFAAIPCKADHLIANTKYGGRDVCAVAGVNNVFGTQFHPEKSGPAGLAILETFLQF